MQFDESIFKAYDIRGTYPDQINANLYKCIGTATAKTLGCKTCVVGRDMRTSSEELSAAFAEGMIAAGVDVTDVGLVSTDALYFAVGKYRYDCGAMVTASHNPAKYNGLKMCKSRAVPLSSDMELKQIKRLLQANCLQQKSPRGHISQKNVINDFIDHVLSFVDVSALKSFKIAVDAGNGMGGLIVPELFEKIPGKLVPIYFELDGSFPNHPASPIEPENIVDLQNKIKEIGADFGAAFDGDADRVFLVDENAKPLGGDMVTAMVAKSILAKQPGSKIIYNLICSKSVPEVVTEFGGSPFRTRVGHAFIKKIMKEENAVFGGEHSGHFYFRDNWYADSGLIAFVVCLELLSRAEMKLSKLVEQFDSYKRSGEINSRVEDIPGKLKELESEFEGAQIDHLDGVTIETEGYWFNVRPSNTEPLLRLNIEADSDEILEKAKSKVLGIIRG